MENVKHEKGEEKENGFGQKFMNFLAYGGFLIIIVVIAVIVITVRILMK